MTAAGFPSPRTWSSTLALKAGDRVLDIGCAKGFLVKDLMNACPGLEAFGLDISHYALMHCEPETIGRLHLGNAAGAAVSGRQLQGARSRSTPFTISTAPAASRR